MWDWHLVALGVAFGIPGRMSLGCKQSYLWHDAKPCKAVCKHNFNWDAWGIFVMTPLRYLIRPLRDLDVSRPGIKQFHLALL